MFKYEFMTSVQTEILPLTLNQDKKYLLVKAGTVKTFAFMISTVERIKLMLLKGRPSDIHCLIVSPMRDLALQIGAKTDNFAMFHNA